MFIDEPASAGLELRADADLSVVLDAWNAATDRLQKTHEVLRTEVRRLSDELEVKNRELARKNRLADLGQMASHVAHEVRNSLVPMKLYLSLLARKVSQTPDCPALMEKIESGFRALEVTVNDLLHFTSEREPCRRPFPANGLLTEIVDSLRPQLDAQQITARIDAAADVKLNADTEMLRRAILNLVLNAVDALANGGTLTLAAEHRGEFTMLTVADDGPGLDGEALERVCEPFFTTKSGGTGLGLAIVDRIVSAHGGELTAENGAGGGAKFAIHLPRAANDQKEAA